MDHRASIERICGVRDFAGSNTTYNEPTKLCVDPSALLAQSLVPVMASRMASRSRSRSPVIRLSADDCLPFDLDEQWLLEEMRFFDDTKYDINGDLSQLFAEKKKYVDVVFKSKGRDVMFATLSKTRRLIRGEEKCTVEIQKIMVSTPHRNTGLFNTLVHSLQKSFENHVIRIESANAKFSNYLRNSKTFHWYETGTGDFVV